MRVGVEEVLRRFDSFSLFDEATKRRVKKKIEEALKKLREENGMVEVYSFAGPKVKVAETDGSVLIVHPPFSKEKIHIRPRWAIIGDLGVFGEEETGKHFVFPYYTRGPGKVIAIIVDGALYHRGGLYVVKK